MRRWTRSKDSLSAGLNSFDQFAEHLVNFQTQMHVTGNLDEPLPESALKRLVSLYVVQALKDDYVDEVYDSLIDCYVWSSKVSSLEQPRAEVRQLASKKGLKLIDAEPVVFEE
jgi:hypothetical protein